MIILYQYASRCRPARFFAGLSSILENQHDMDNFFIHAVLDKDDPTIDDDFISKINLLDSLLPGKIIWNFGESRGKIHAINRKLPDVTWDILINFSDDMRFIVKGFDRIIRAQFAQYGLDSFLHFPDQDAGETLCTMTIEGRRYYERDGSIYHPSYFSLWADNEAMEKAKMRGKYRFVNIRIYDHLLPAMGHLPRDAQFDFQQNYYETDRRNFESRKKYHFGLPCNI